MEGERDLTDPLQNDAIPNDNPDPEVMANEMIPAEFKPEDPHFSQRIMEQLSSSEMARVGENIVISRRYNHQGAGGESFTLLDSETGAEKSGISLGQLSGVKNEKELRELLDES